MPQSNAVPNDPLFRFQWGLRNTGQAHGGVGVDIDVLPVWADYTGQGVRVGVVDNGTQLDHPDLVANIDPSATWDAGKDRPGGGPSSLQYFHGTATAGIIAAAANNGIGGTGVAPGAKLGIYRIALQPEPPATVADQYAVAFRHALNDRMDVVNNSWGSPTPFQHTNPGIKDLAVSGRGGLGSVVVFSNTNQRTDGADSVLNSRLNSPYVIAVGAIDNNGVASAYSTPGINLLVTAPGGASTTQLTTVPGNGIVTTDTTGTAGANASPGIAGDYTYGFSGTSAAAPFVSGVAALVLQANPALNYREVQQTLAMSARMNDETSVSWNANRSGDWNGGGSEYSRNYGFGLVDARAAVRLAESYVGRNVLGAADTASGSFTPAAPLDIADAPDGKKPTWISLDVDGAVQVEHVSLNLRLNVQDSEDVNVSLFSPSGKGMYLFRSVKTASGLAWPKDGFTVSSPAFWGENSKGTWKVGIWSSFADVDAQPLEQVQGVSLSVSGQDMPASREVVYTDDFPMLAAMDPSRLTISHTGAPETVNASAVSGPVNLDLAARTLSVGGTVSTIDPLTTIGTVYGGDGDDAFAGDGSNVVFSPGRGNNSVDGRGGGTVQLLGNLSGYSGMRHGSSTVLAGAESRDTLTGVGALRFRDGTLRLGSDPLVDPVFYDKANPDVYAQGVSAEMHYASFGWQEGRDPDALFSTTAYLANHKDVAAAGQNPLSYYDAVGWRNGDNPSAGFDAGLYLKLNPDVLAAGVDPLRHFLQYGEAEGRRALPVVDSARIVGGFDPTYYNLANPDVASSGMDPAAHWLAYGQAEQRNPDAFFNTGYYLSHNPDVGAAHVDPLQHYLTDGWKEGRDPSGAFSTDGYLGASLDVKAAGMNPLVHFLYYGAAEGRMAVAAS